MSSVSSTSTLASWDAMELFELVNPDKLSISCVGYAPSCRRRCRNPIAYHNVQAAKALMRQLVRPVATNNELKDMLFRLAEYTLCRRYHQNQARTVSDGWFVRLQRHLNNEDDRGSDTSEDDNDDSDIESSTGSDSDSDSDDDDSNDAAAQASRNDARELRRRFDELETLQREFEDLLRRQRENIRNRVPALSFTNHTKNAQVDSRLPREIDRRDNTTHQQHSREARRNAEQRRQEEAHQTAERNRAATREQLRRERAEQVKRDEAIRQAQREQVEREAKAEAERLLKKRQAEKARLERERRAKEEEEARLLSWESAWSRYETAWDEFAFSSRDADIRNCAIWPTKSGSFDSCCEEDVKAFLRCRPEGINRRMLRRQALRWHPDRAARLMARLTDGEMAGDVLKTVTMISQVVIAVMGVTAL